jgi:hypothetical protein
MKFRITLFSLAMALPVVLFVFFRFTPIALSGVEVASQTCDESDSIETTTMANWNGAALALTITEPENCAYSLQAANVQRIGSHLFVRTSYASPSGMATGCHCQHATTLRIQGLPRQPFQVHTYSWL